MGNFSNNIKKPNKPERFIALHTRNEERIATNNLDPEIEKLTVVTSHKSNNEKMGNEPDLV